MSRLALALDTFRQDQRGAFAAIAAFGMPVMISAAVLGTEVGLYAFRHQSMQGAADAAALSGVISKAAGSALIAQGKAIAATQGYADGVNGVTVTINSPPTSGAYTTKAGAVEAIVAQPQQPLLAKFFSSASINVRARAVAIENPGGACVLALSKTAKRAISVQGTANVSITGCDAFSNSVDDEALTAEGSSRLSVNSAFAVGQIPKSDNITAPGGIYDGTAPALDPYANANFGSCTGCAREYNGGSTTLYPGVYSQKSGIKIVAGSTVTMAPGIYYLAGGDLEVQGNATLTGTGVTIVFTSGNGKDYGGANIASNAVVNLSAPTSGPTAGIVLFGDRNSPEKSFRLEGGGTQQWTGAIYLPKGNLTYAGGATGGMGCTQIVTNTATFTGTSNLSLSCAGTGVKPAGTQAAILVE